MKIRRIQILLTLALVATPLRAHDFWIEPSTFRPEVGSLITARVFVGQDFSGDPFPRNDAHIVRFNLTGPGGESRMIGQAGRDPAGIARVESPGLLMIGYESQPTDLELSADKLRTYISDEGLEPFFRGDPSQPIQDHFTRCAKSLLLAGDSGPRHDGYARRLGCELELVSEADPYATGKDTRFPVRLLQGGKPLKGALVIAMRRDQPENKIRARTDAQGRVRLPLSGSGIWLVKSVWVRPVPGKDREWESYWASLTFERPEPKTARPSEKAHAS